ncbi:MAG: cation transporter [Chloroflexales bacterium]|nr:cation transporter [Chloroflexales bacterium]
MAGASSGHERPIAVYGAMVANGVIAAAKFTAAFFTGSSAMISEGVHSVVDTANEGLLLVGIKRSKRGPDEGHPFGHGKELYFWSLLVAIVLFGVGGGISFYEGVTHLTGHVAKERQGSVWWNYGVLGIALLAEGTSWVIALRQFLPTVEDESFWHALRTSKDPTVVTVIAEDSAALIGLVFAFFGVLLTQLTGNPMWDGIASILIGLTLGAVAFFLAYESRGLLIGESADPDVVEDVRRIAREDCDVAEVGQPLTMHLGPKEVLLNLDVRFHPELPAEQVTAAVDRLEQAIRDKHPEIKRIFIEAEAFRSRQRERAAGERATRQ